MQAQYWKCLRGLGAQERPYTLQTGLFDIPADVLGPMTASGLTEAAIDASDPSSREASPGIGSDRGGRSAEGVGGNVSPRSGVGSAHSLERSMRRSKLPRRQYGKSCRRWHMLQSLHLAVVKSFLKQQRRRQHMRRGGGGGGGNGNGVPAMIGYTAERPRSANAAATAQQ